jgi:hypothetical protein
MLISSSHDRGDDFAGNSVAVFSTSTDRNGTCDHSECWAGSIGNVYRICFGLVQRSTSACKHLVSWEIMDIDDATAKVHNMADAGEVLLGPFGREFGGAAQTIFSSSSWAATSSPPR